MTPSSVGQQLAQARAALRVSVKDIAQATKIQPWVLEALETDRLHTAMSPIYVKSFLATYAKFLRLDPGPLTKQLFPDPPTEPAPHSVASAESATPAAVSLEALPWPSFRLVGVLAVALVGVVVLVKTHPFRRLATHLPRQEASVSMAPQLPKPAELDPTMTVQPTLPLELAVVARRPTWISVKADGKLVTQQQLAAGAQERWSARHRFEVIVSKPSQIDLLLNGQPISPLLMAHQGRLVITHNRITALTEPSPPQPRPSSAPASGQSKKTAKAAASRR